MVTRVYEVTKLRFLFRFFAQNHTFLLWLVGFLAMASHQSDFNDLCSVGFSIVCVFFFQRCFPGVKKPCLISGYFTPKNNIFTTGPSCRVGNFFQCKKNMAEFPSTKNRTLAYWTFVKGDFLQFYQGKSPSFTTIWEIFFFFQQP